MKYLIKEELIAKIQEIEWDDFEAKTAKTELPKNTWDTVSSFSNTSGGWILCGVAQHGKKFEIEGIDNGEKIESDFNSTLRNGKFNQVLLAQGKKYVIDGKLVLAFYVPSSPLKPIWYNSPKNTFIRAGSTDQRATDLEIAALYRDQAFGTQSEKTIEGTSFDDLNAASLASYRRRLKDVNPSFFANDYDDERFCKATSITKYGMLTYAGLLMFGSFEQVRVHCGNFWVDYLEVPGTSYDDAAVRFSYRLPEQDNLWESYRALIQRLRLHVDAAPFTPGPDGFAPEDESQLYALREGLVNLESHSDFFSPMHPTIRVFDNRIEFQNPGRFILGLEHLRDRIQSAPRNPTILKLFRYAKLSENAGYGINKIYSWERLTGEKVEFSTDTMSTTVTYWRPKVGTSIHRGDKEGHGSTTEKTTKKDYQETTKNLRDKIYRIIKSSPDIKIQEIADICGLTYDGVRYHTKALKKAGFIDREGGDNGGHWVILK